MNKFKSLCVATCVFASIGIANAGSVCNGFEIKLKNNLPDDFILSTIKLDGANIEPGMIDVLKAGSEQVFTVNGATGNQVMNGVIKLHSISLPSKSVNIDFSLEDKTVLCQHNDIKSDGDYSVSKMRVPGGVTYKIN